MCMWNEQELLYWAEKTVLVIIYLECSNPY